MPKMNNRSSHGNNKKVLKVDQRGRDIHIECSKQFKKNLILLCVRAERAVLGSAETALKFNCEI